MKNCHVSITYYSCRSEKGRVAALTTSQMNGLIPFERTIEQTTEAMSLALKQ